MGYQSIQRSTELVSHTGKICLIQSQRFKGFLVEGGLNPGYKFRDLGKLAVPGINHGINSTDNNDYNQKFEKEAKHWI